MTILVAAERLGPAGGMERFLEIVLPALAARGVKLHAIAREIAEIPAGVSAELVPWAEEHGEPDAPARTHVEGVLATLAPDVTLVENVMDAGIVEALRAAPRSVYHVHDHRPFCPNGDRVYPRSGRICTSPIGAPCLVHALTDGCAYGPRARTIALVRRRLRLRNAIAAADAVIVASRYVAERATASGIPSERIREIPAPLADDAYASEPNAATSRDVAFIGRVVPQKGLTSLVRALSCIAPERRPSLHVYGAGPGLPEAIESAARAGVTMTAHGAVSPADVRAGIDGSAIIALPAQWGEPFGIVGIEAFARGRTVVAYDVGGVRAWLDDGANGLTVPARDERALGAAIAALLDDDTLRNRLAARARADAERFHAGPIVDALLRACSA